MKQLNELLKAIEPIYVIGPHEVEVQDITIDSRAVKHKPTDMLISPRPSRRELALWSVRNCPRNYLQGLKRR